MLGIEEYKVFGSSVFGGNEFFTRPWYICPSGPRSLSVGVISSLSVVPYLERREYVSIPNVSLGSWVNILGVLMGRLHMGFVKLMRSQLILRMSSIEKGAA